VCPLSNEKLCVVPTLGDHNFARLLRRGVAVTINSDDPAYFGGYVADNYRATAAALDLTAADLVTIAENAVRGSFLPDAAKAELLGRVRNEAARA
jgi:adenosine deaminase